MKLRWRRAIACRDGPAIRLGAYSYGLPIRKCPVASCARNALPSVQSPLVTFHVPLARSGLTNRPVIEKRPFPSGSLRSTENAPALEIGTASTHPVALQRCDQTSRLASRVPRLLTSTCTCQSWPPV